MTRIAITNLLLLRFFHCLLVKLMLHRIVSPFSIVVINRVPIIVYMYCSSVAEPKKDRARICKRTRVYAFDRCRGEE
jgi:hypothetical protein